MGAAALSAPAYHVTDDAAQRTFHRASRLSLNVSSPMKLSLAIKFNLVFVTIFAVGLAAAGVVADRVLQQQALDETRHDADVLISAAGSMQNYTAQHITPLLATQIK